MRLFFLFLCYLIFSIVIIKSPSSEAANFSEKHFSPFANRLLDSTSALVFLAAAGSVAVVNNNDQQIRDDWKDHQKMPSNQSKIGDILGTGVPGLMIVAGQFYLDSNENHYQSHLRSLVYGTLGVYSLKYAFKRSRPGNSQNQQSFPSGHTMTAFATATAMTYAYGWKAAIVAYPVAAFVGLSRLADDNHWGSDVVGGAFLGFILARASCYDAEPEKNIEKNANQSLWFFFPVVGPDHQGAGLVLSF